MDKSIKFSIIAGILLISLSFFYYLVIFLPQKERTRQAQQIREYNDKVRTEQEEKEKAEQAKSTNDFLLNICLDEAEKNYWNYMKLNGTEKEDGTVWAQDKYWDRGEKNKKDEIANCYKKYPIE